MTSPQSPPTIRHVVDDLAFEGQQNEVAWIICKCAERFDTIADWGLHLREHNGGKQRSPNLASPYFNRVINPENIGREPS